MSPGACRLFIFPHSTNLRTEFITSVLLLSLRASLSNCVATSSTYPRSNAMGAVMKLGFRFLTALLVTVAAIVAQVPITFQYFYDDTGQLTKVVDSTGVVIEYIYDPVGNMLEKKRSSVAPGVLTIFSFTPQRSGPLALVTLRGQGLAQRLR